MNSGKDIDHPHILLSSQVNFSCMTTVVKTDLVSYYVCLILSNFEFSLNFNLRASNFQNFPEGMPTDPLIGKACFVVYVCFTRKYYNILYFVPDILTLTYYCGPLPFIIFLYPCNRFLKRRYCTLIHSDNLYSLFCDN